MKTEIDRICGIMYTLLEHQPVIDVPYEKINDIAVALVKEGYGKVSEYKAEIENLKDEIICLERKIAIRDNALKDRDKAIEMLEGKQDTIVKQAKIDVLNKVMNYINNKIENDYGDMSDSVNYLTINIDEFDDFIDELIKEEQDETI